MGFGSGGEPFDVDAMWQGAIDGLQQGITNVALQWATEAIGLDPLTGAVISNIFAAGLEGLLNHENILENIGQHMLDGVLHILPTGSDSPDPWMRAVYISQTNK